MQNQTITRPFTIEFWHKKQIDCAVVDATSFDHALALFKSTHYYDLIDEVRDTLDIEPDTQEQINLENESNIARLTEISKEMEVITERIVQLYEEKQKLQGFTVLEYITTQSQSTHDVAHFATYAEAQAHRPTLDLDKGWHEDDTIEFFIYPGQLTADEAITKLLD